MAVQKGRRACCCARRSLLGTHWRKSQLINGTERGWLEASLPLHGDETIAAALGSPRKASSTISTLASHRDQVRAWVEQGVSGTAIHAALNRRHGFTGSYSTVCRLVADTRSHLPPETTCRLHFEPGDAAQVAFGAGPTLISKYPPRLLTSARNRDRLTSSTGRR